MLGAATPVPPLSGPFVGTNPAMQASVYPRSNITQAHMLLPTSDTREENHRHLRHNKFWTDQLSLIAELSQMWSPFQENKIQYPTRASPVCMEDSSLLHTHHCSQKMKNLESPPAHIRCTPSPSFIALTRAHQSAPHFASLPPVKSLRLKEVG